MVTMSKDLRYKVSEEDRIKIKELWDTGEYKYSELSRMFGVAHTTIMRIVNPEFRARKNKFNSENWKRYRPSNEKHAMYMRMYRARKNKRE